MYSQFTCTYIVCVQELQSGHLSELENEAKLKEEKLSHAVQHLTTAQENLQVDCYGFSEVDYKLYVHVHVHVYIVCVYTHVYTVQYTCVLE